MLVAPRDASASTRAQIAMDRWGSPHIALAQSALQVRDHGGLRPAANALQVHPSFLSRQIGRLERALRATLFHRTGAQMQPTAVGERYLRDVEEALRILESAVADASAAGRGEQGQLRLGYVWPVWMGPAERILRAYRQAAPRVELSLREGSAAVLAAAVLDRELDIALVGAEDVPPDLDRMTLWSEPWLLASPRDASPLKRLDAPVLCSANDDYRQIGRLAAAGAVARGGVRAQSTSHQAVLSLVAAGEGLAIVPESVASGTRIEVRFSPLPRPTAPLRVCAVWRRDHDNPALRRFLGQLRRLSAEPAMAEDTQIQGHAAL